MNTYKVGDWVRTSAGYIKPVLRTTSEQCDTLTIGNKSLGINVVLKSEIELWEPKENEYCWHYSMLGQVTSIDNNKIIFAVKTSDGDMHNFILDSYDELEPFLGTLPSFLQN